MSETIFSSLSSALEALFGPGTVLCGERGVGGGCINDTGILTHSKDGRVFIKRNRRGSLDLFLRESEGLKVLGSVGGAPRVPRPLAAGTDGASAFLLLEYLEEDGRNDDFWECFGRELAALHRNGRADRCGFASDNHIGATPQRNGYMDSWIEFFQVRRIGYQLKLARDRGLAEGDLSRLVGRVMEKLDRYLIEPDDRRASLLHGDLWSGNFIAGPDGRACIIDPAVYYGHREADLAMTELFGGYNRAFYQAYDAAWPLEPGYAERRDLYNLYHMLNHLNLFGGGYAGSVRSIAARYA